MDPEAANEEDLRTPAQNPGLAGRPTLCDIDVYNATCEAAFTLPRKCDYEENPKGNWQRRFDDEA